MENRSEIPEKQKASLGSPLMDCCASSIRLWRIHREYGWYPKNLTRENAIKHGNETPGTVKIADAGTNEIIWHNAKVEARD